MGKDSDNPCAGLLVFSGSLIFCSLYQIYHLHFREMGRIGKTVTVGVLFQHGPQVADVVGFPAQFIVTAQSMRKSCD